MTFDDIYSRLLDKFGDTTITGKNAEAIDPWIEVAPEAIAEVGRYLKHDEALLLDSLNDLSAVDYLEPDEKLAKKFPYEPHLEIVYHLYSYTHKHWLTIKVKLPRWKGGVEGQLPDVPTVSHIWGIADWHEREAYDLMGINFVGHPNLVRILCTDDWVGHPLRKDYEFPLEYHSIRGM